jgi:hypothetical protein
MTGWPASATSTLMSAGMSSPEPTAMYPVTADDTEADRTRRPIGATRALLVWLAALPVGAVVGVVLGWWCRAYAGALSVNGVLADIGAPWIAAAFVAGAVAALAAVPLRRATTGAFQLSAALAGSLAGATALVVATVVYYGPARTGHLDVSGAGTRTVVWTAIGIVVGVVCGGFGALWRAVSGPTGAAACLVVVGVAITSEAFYLLDAGASNDRLVRSVLVGVAVVGIALPLLAGPRWQAVAGAVVVIALALPGSLVAEIVSRGALDSVTLLRDHVARS